MREKVLDLMLVKEMVEPWEKLLVGDGRTVGNVVGFDVKK